MLSEDAYTSYAEEDDEEELEDWPGDPRTPSRRFHRRALTDDDDDELLDGDELIDEDGDGDEEQEDEPTQGFATHTAFDAYFQLASKPARTSANVFSALVPPLTPSAAAAALASHRARSLPSHLPSQPHLQPHKQLWTDARLRTATYRRFRTELAEGFSLLLYGCGSKRAWLNGFAAWLAEEARAHVVVANGFQPGFALRDLVGAVERVPGVLGGEGEASSGAGAGAGAGGLDAQVQRIHAFFSRPSPSPSSSSPSSTPAASSSRADPNPHQDLDADADEPPHLYIIIHNIESAAFRAPKARAALALLALAPRIHLCASFDHVVGAPLRWSTSELFARKPPPASGAAASASDSRDGWRAGAYAPPKRGFAWLWHDVTTLAPYDAELAYADPTSVTGASALRGARASASATLAAGGAGTGAGGGGGGVVTETAARHVLASVTQKAKKLFVLLGTKQLEVMDAPAGASAAEGQDKGGEGEGGEGAGEGAYDYDRLFAAARDNFVAQNDTALRALLREFRDHGLVVTTATPGGGGGEALWIPMRREALLKVVADL
ncbi:origin recognition complex subunit 2, partial [Trametes cingulata]